MSVTRRCDLSARSDASHTDKTRNTQTAVLIFFFGQFTTQNEISNLPHKINCRLRRNNNLIILNFMLSTKNMQITNNTENEAQLELHASLMWSHRHRILTEIKVYQAYKLTSFSNSTHPTS